MCLREWEVQQEKVFVGWVNSVLNQHEDGKGGEVESLGTAFAETTFIGDPLLPAQE